MFRGGTEWTFETPKPILRDHPSIRSIHTNLYNPFKYFHSLMIKHSNILAYGDYHIQTTTTCLSLYFFLNSCCLPSKCTQDISLLILLDFTILLSTGFFFFVNSLCNSLYSWLLQSNLRIKIRNAPFSSESHLHKVFRMVFSYLTATIIT